MWRVRTESVIVWTIEEQNWPLQQQRFVCTSLLLYSHMKSIPDSGVLGQPGRLWGVDGVLNVWQEVIFLALQSWPSHHERINYRTAPLWISIRQPRPAPSASWYILRFSTTSRFQGMYCCINRQTRDSSIPYWIQHTGFAFSIRIIDK